MYRSLILLFCAILSLGACAQNSDMADQKSSLALEKMPNIEDETITRMSFVPVQNSSEDLKVVVYQDGTNLNKIIPASGDDLSDKNSPQ